MKCPHCNQEHPEGTKFCPQTGKLIQQLLSCPNYKCKNFDKYNLLLDTRFCPECGTPIQSVPSGEDISVHEIVLGQTTLRELRQKGYEIENDEGQYTVDIDDDSFDVKLFCATYREVEEFSKNFIEPSVFNKDFILNTHKTVSLIEFNSFDDCGVFKKIGLSDDCDEDEIIEILEDNGYMQIENFLKDEDDVVPFVRERKDSAGNTIFLTIHSCQNGGIFFANLLNEWKSYKTGKTFYAK